MQHQIKHTTEIQVPFLTKLMLSPTKAVYQQCSDHTRNNLTAFSRILALTVSVSGFIFGASLSHFCFHDNTTSYCITIPLSITFYALLDRLVVMADNRKNLSFIRNSRYAIALIFGLFNSFLCDSFFYSSDIAAARAKEIVVAEQHIQQQTDEKKKAVQLHKESIYKQTNEATAPLRKRSDDLVKEAEGGGPTGESGAGPIYEAKKAAFVRDSMEFARQNAHLLAEAANDDSTLKKLDAQAVKDKARVPQQISTGVAHTCELLHEVIFSKPLNIFISFLFLAVCMILELLPLLAKHYIDIEEYFEHVKSHIEAFLANRETHKQQTIKRLRHAMTLLHERTLQQLSHQHAMKTLTARLAHNEQILEETDKHFAFVVSKEKQMNTHYPTHFQQHIKPVFSNVYDTFQEYHPQAFEREPVETV